MMNNKLTLFKTLLAIVLCTWTTTTLKATEISYTLPSKVNNVRQTAISLNGEWELKFSPDSRWSTVKVPGELAMQGFAIEHDRPVIYRKSFSLPKDYTNKRTILRFDGVYSHAKLYINGKFVREHHGGFTRWESDITELVKPNRQNELTLEVTDRLDDISYASGYAHHPIGGILRDVTIFALPTDHLTNVNIETILDSTYRNADLRFSCNFNGSNNTQIEFNLTDANGRTIKLDRSTFELNSGVNTFTLPVENPQKWDAEHPVLYTLSINVKKNNESLSDFHKQIGFRKIEIKGDKMLVNGRVIKLRGACRHDIHPQLGRTTTAELDSLDVVLFKRSNMNFVRTSHYPPTERFLEFCDRFGLYVECETAVCFVDTYRQKNYAPANTQSDSTFTDRYMGQCIEMVNSLRTHPSIIMWSIGNESIYGSNFQRCWDWVKATDTTRPVIFSYPGTTGEKVRIFDILSMHYQNVNGNVHQFGMGTTNFQGHGIPALFDEWAHPACYTYTTLQNDPNIREFWGRSLDMMWSGLFKAPGGLGGAIWGYIDETFALPEPTVGTAFWEEFAHTAKPDGFRGNCVGYGQWGIVDIWRREKPEFWSTKKAYSPIRIVNADKLSFTPGMPIMATLHNRFDHTNLNEIKATYTYKGIKGDLIMANIEPHAKGMLTIPAQQWSDGDDLLIEFFDRNGELIDAYRPTLGTAKITYPSPMAEGKITVNEANGFVTVVGDNFTIPFDKSIGMITKATVGNRVIIEKGPFLNLYVNLNHLTGAEVRKNANHFTVDESQWKLSAFDWKKSEEGVDFDIRGTYNSVAVEMKICVSNNGVLNISYTTDGLPNGFLRETGISFHLPETIRDLEWSRRGYWDYYPQGEFAGNQGRTTLYNTHSPAYGQDPKQPWADDTHDYYYWSDKGANCAAPLRQIAKGMKENIHHYSISTGENQLSVISRDASLACRMNKRADEQLILYINNRWDYPEIAWGNYCKTLEALPCYGQIEMLLK